MGISMYALMLRSIFIAQHFLIGKDFGSENFKHSHRYTFELEVESQHLDEFNYIIDIVEMRKHMEQLISCYHDKTLNELPEFANQNPSLELFCKILWQKFTNHFKFQTDCQITVRLWEDEIAQASYREFKKCE